MNIYEIDEKLSHKMDAKRFSNFMSIALTDNFGLYKYFEDYPMYLTKDEYLRYWPIGSMRPLEERLTRPPKTLGGVKNLSKKLIEKNIEPKDYTVRTVLNPDKRKINFAEHVVIFAHHNNLYEFENKLHNLKENSVDIVSKSPLGFPEEVLKKKNITENCIGLKPTYAFFFKPIQIIEKAKGKDEEKMLHNFI